MTIEQGFIDIFILIEKLPNIVVPFNPFTERRREKTLRRRLTSNPVQLKKNL